MLLIGEVDSYTISCHFVFSLTIIIYNTDVINCGV